MSAKFDALLGRLRTADSGGGGSANTGGVWITNVQPQGSGNVNVTMKSGSIVVDSIVTDTDLVTVTVLALPGTTNYKPTVTVNGQNVTLSAASDKPTFTGTINIDLNGGTSIGAVHEDGASSSVTVTADAGPEIQTLEFTGDYPGTQTELKAGDTYSLRVVSDTPMTRIEVYNEEACQAETFNFSAVTEKTVTVTIADRGTTTQSLRARARAMNSNGSYGGSAYSSNTVDLNNTYPSISFGSIVYPVGQGALKNSEQATVNHTVTDFDSIAYSSPISQLTIANTATYEAAKTVTRAAGDYNDSSNNFRVTATRAANAASTTANTIVEIAHVAPSITITKPAARLRSGGNQGTSAQNYTITLSSNQKLGQTPTLTAPAGTFTNTFSGGPKVYTRTFQVHDDDTKGSYTFGGLTAVNKAGLQTTIATGQGYVLGGFVFRTLTVAAFPNRSTAIGTNVANTAKLRCSNLSKGDSGSLNFTYQSAITDAENRFTIVDNADNFDADGGYWYNCDAANASSNSSGTMQIELEEVV